MSSEKKCQENDASRGSLSFGSNPLAGPCLYMVAVPIGNPDDLSPRALHTLQKADFVLAEDTRKAMELSRAHRLDWQSEQIQRWDAHRERESVQKTLKQIQKEKGNWVLVTDAGTPGFQDPGSLLVRLAREAGIPVVPIPGPSALMTFISAAGLEGSSFVFRGYFPREHAGQKKEVELWQQSGASVSNWIYFESPERIENTLAFLSGEYWGAEKNSLIHFCGAKELTKTHEAFWSGTPAQVLQKMRSVSDPMVFRGEWVFSVSLKQNEKIQNSNQLPISWKELLQILLAEKVSVRRAVDILVSKFSLNKNEVYSTAIDLQKKELRGD